MTGAARAVTPEGQLIRFAVRDGPMRLRDHRRPVSETLPSARAGSHVAADGAARLDDPCARLRVRLAASSVHRLRRGLGSPHRARHRGGDRPARTRPRTGAHGSLDVSSLPARPRLVARKRGVPLLELRRADPPPPGASLVQYAYFRRDGYPADTAGLAAAGTFLFPTLGRFLLPVVAVLVLLVTGEVDGTVAIAGGVALLVTAAAAFAGYLLLRSERSARWLGARLQRPLNRIRSLFKREPIEELAAKAGALRSQTLVHPPAGLEAGDDRGRGQPPAHIPDPARLAAIRGRDQRRAVLTRCLRRLRHRLLGRSRLPGHRKRPRRRGRRSGCHALRAQRRIGRRPGGCRAPVAGLLLGGDPAAGSGHLEPFPRREVRQPPRRGCRCGCRCGRADIMAR